MCGGVYAIESTDGRRYIGSSVNIAKRIKEHRGYLVRGEHHSRFLQRAWDKHGESAFTFKPLLYCAREHLLMFEQRCIDGFKPEYNVEQIAGSPLGVKRSDETRAKQAERWKQVGLTPARRAVLDSMIAGNVGKIGRNTPDEVRRKIADALKGRRLPREQVDRMASKIRGIVRTPEQRERMAEAARRRWASTSEEIRRAHMDAARAGVRIGRKASPEAIESMKRAAERRWSNPEYREAQRLARRRAKEPN